MLLTYALNIQDPTRLQVLPLMAEIKLGGALGRTVYPVDAERLLKAPPPNLTMDKADRRIAMQLLMHESARSKEIFFSGKAAAQVVDDLVATGRCYLWHQREAPLTRIDPIKTKPIWQSDDEGLVPTFDLPLRGVLLPCTPPYVVHRGALGVAPVESALSDETAAEWVRPGRSSADEAAVLVARLLKRYPGAVLPPPPAFEH